MTPGSWGAQRVIHCTVLPLVIFSDVEDSNKTSGLRDGTQSRQQKRINETDGHRNNADICQIAPIFPKNEHFILLWHNGDDDDGDDDDNNNDGNKNNLYV